MNPLWHADISGCFASDIPGSPIIDSAQLRFIIDPGAFSGHQKSKDKDVSYRAGTVRDEDTCIMEINAREPCVGMQIDRYRLEKRIGSGGFASVWRARHTLLDTCVAIKFIHPERSTSDALCTEARSVAGMNHPNLVMIIDVQTETDMPCVIMEFIDGQTIHQLITDRGRIPWDNALHIGRQVCLGLQSILGRGIIHRDIKPANLIITNDGLVKVVDFGLAIQHTSSAESNNLVIGTPSYMSPEQALKPSSCDFRSDLYSLGCTLYQSITGAVPYVAERSTEILVRHASWAVPDVRDRQNDVPALVADFIRSLMAKEAVNRPSSYDAAISTIDSLLNNTGKSSHGRIIGTVKNMFRR